MPTRVFDHTRLRGLRDERGLTRDRLAYKAGLTADGITKLEQGRRVPRADTLARLADALGCPIDSMFRMRP